MRSAGGSPQCSAAPSSPRIRSTPSLACPDSRAALVQSEKFTLLLQKCCFCKWKMQLPNLLHGAQRVEEMGAQLGRNSGISLYRDVEFLMKKLIKNTPVRHFLQTQLCPCSRIACGEGTLHWIKGKLLLLLAARLCQQRLVHARDIFNICK